MPMKTWKKAKIADGLLSGFRSKPGGSFVVQTGFPTSLADLIDKNHVRMKKSSLKSKRKASPSSDLAVASAGATFRGRGSSLSENENLSRCISVENTIGTNLKVGYGFGFWFPAGKVMLLAALVVIGKKTLVLGITVSAFALLILELYGFRAFRFLNPCDDGKKCLHSVIGISVSGGRELSSPIRETIVQPRIDSSISVAKCHEGNGISRKGHDLANKACVFSRKSKAKKLFRSFFPKKLRGDGDDGTAPSCTEAIEVELTDHKDLLMREEDGDSDTESLSFKTNFGDLDDGNDAYVTHRTLEVNRFRRFAVSVFFVAVLFGLVKGKAVALLLALAWCFLFRFIEAVSFWSKSRLR